jgi:hypothetical protein
MVTRCAIECPATALVGWRVGPVMLDREHDAGEWEPDGPEDRHAGCLPKRAVEHEHTEHR